MLIAVYVILAIAATFRSIFQIIRRFDEAPVAYSLSAVAALVYVLATIALIKRTGVWRKIAWVAISFELVGVLTVGVLSITVPEWFGHASVWSNFGQGYGYIPLVLPVLGLIWLGKDARAARAPHRGGGA